MSTRITIIGLGQMGASIGLALRRHEKTAARQAPVLEIVGHDREPETARRAQALGCVQRIGWNLPRAVEQAGVVVLALPLASIRETLEVIAPALGAGCVVTDTAPLKRPLIEWAGQFLRLETYYLGSTPVLSPGRLLDDAGGVEAARADLFEGGLWALTPGPNVPPEVVKLGVDLARLLGATPLFLDPDEHDGLMAGVDALPGLMATALLRAATLSPGWSDQRKLADRAFAAATAAASMGAAARSAEMILNRDNVLRYLDAAMSELAAMRRSISEGDDAAIDAAFEAAAQARARWLAERREGKWEAAEIPSVELPTPGEALGRILGLGRLAGERRERRK